MTTLRDSSSLHSRVRQISSLRRSKQLDLSRSSPRLSKMTTEFRTARDKEPEANRHQRDSATHHSRKAIRLGTHSSVVKSSNHCSRKRRNESSDHSFPTTKFPGASESIQSSADVSLRRPDGSALGSRAAKRLRLTRQGIRPRRSSAQHRPRSNNLGSNDYHVPRHSSSRASQVRYPNSHHYDVDPNNDRC